MKAICYEYPSEIPVGVGFLPAAIKWADALFHSEGVVEPCMGKCVGMFYLPEGGLGLNMEIGMDVLRVAPCCGIDSTTGGAVMSWAGWLGMTYRS